MNQQAPGLAGQSQYHVCASGSPACSGVYPCPACLEHIQRKALVAAAAVDGELLRQLYQALRVLQDMGIHPSQIGIFPRAPQEQADAFFGAYFAGLRELHEEMAGPGRAAFVFSPVTLPQAPAYAAPGPWADAMGRQISGSAHGPFASSQPLAASPQPLAGVPLASIFGGVPMVPPAPAPVAQPAVEPEDERAARRRAARAEADDLDRRAEARERQRREREAEEAEKLRLEALTKPMDAEEILATAEVAPPDEHEGLAGAANGALPS